MRPQHISEAILALLLALTLSLKIAVGPTVASEEIATGHEASVATFLERQGFTVGALLPDISPPMLPARKSSCALRAVEVSPFGWQQAVLAELAQPGERLHFVFRGKVSTSQPTWATFFDYYRRRMLSNFGIRPPDRPVLGILASDGCDVLGLPWGEVADLP
jgi:hypothetical protein